MMSLLGSVFLRWVPAVGLPSPLWVDSTPGSASSVLKVPLDLSVSALVLRANQVGGRNPRIGPDAAIHPGMLKGKRRSIDACG